MITKLAVCTHQRGSWKWQNRYQLVKYSLHLTRDGRLIWRSSEQLSTKIKPRQIRELLAEGVHYGSLHNKAVA